MRFSLHMGVTVLIVAGAAGAEAQTRFEGLDRNNDGVITRAEWRGNDRSFRNQDWNGDGMLSGDEVRPGARRQDWNQDWNRDGRVDNQDAEIAQRFRGYDADKDGRVASSEWSGDWRLFGRLDTDRDRYLSMQEYTTGAGFRLDAQGGPASRFSNLDTNRDSWVTRNEWNADDDDFNRLDVNRDNRISRVEFEKSTADDDSDDRDDRDDRDNARRNARFASIDANRDGWVTRTESKMGQADFNRIDTNSDNRLSRFEFDNTVSDADPTPRRSEAWRAGHDRGLRDGREAGREDYVRKNGWDLDGQRELETADAGYTSRVGPLSDYQAGYRESFRVAYREGFNSR